MPAQKKTAEQKKKNQKQMMEVDSSNKDSSKKKSANKDSSKNDSSKKDNPKKDSLNVIFIVLVAIVVVIVALVFWRDIFPKQAQTQEKTYNGYVFTQTPPLNLWTVDVRTPYGVSRAEFYFFPGDLQMLDYNPNITRDVASMLLVKGKILIGYDPVLQNEGITAVAGSEISKVTGKIFRINTTSGFIDDLGIPGVPIANCSMQNPKTVVIEFHAATENKIEYSKNCIRIYSATRQDLVRNADYLSYKLLGIIPTFQNATNVNATDENVSINESVVLTNITGLPANE